MSVKEECLSRMIFFGEDSLRRALTQYSEHYHRERNHQGKAYQLLFPPFLIETLIKKRSRPAARVADGFLAG